MRVFISWSGTRSQEVAEELKTWIKKVIQSAEPWVSTDMQSGVKWMADLSDSLDEISIGIICVTPGNVRSPWLNFEAGALSKHLGEQGRVIPYLLDFRSLSDLKQPLAQFNACLADEGGTWQLIKTLNAHAEFRQSEQALRETFEWAWAQLGPRLQRIKDSNKTGAGARRSTDDKVDETLELVRKLIRAQQDADPAEADPESPPPDAPRRPNRR
jgi:hypothetical protein